MTIKFNFVVWINSHELISTLFLFVCLFHQLMFYYQYLHYTTKISGITHYLQQYYSKSLFNAHWNVFWSKSSTELSPEFHGTFWTTFEQHLWFHGIPYNLSNKTPSSMAFHEILSRSKVHKIPMALFPYSRVPWNSMEFHRTSNIPEKSPMAFHRFPWNLINLIFKKIIFPSIVVEICLMIICYLAQISQKRCILHWFQYRNFYFEHPIVSENGKKSAKVACCFRWNVPQSNSENKLTAWEPLAFKIVLNSNVCLKLHNIICWQTTSYLCRLLPFIMPYLSPFRIIIHLKHYEKNALFLSGKS